LDLLMYIIQHCFTCRPSDSTVSEMVGLNHRVDRVLGFISNRPNWDPHPLTRRQLCPLPPLVPGGRTHSVAGEGWWLPITSPDAGGPNSDEGTDTVVL